MRKGVDSIRTVSFSQCVLSYSGLTQYIRPSACVLYVHAPHEFGVGDAAQTMGEQLEGLALGQEHQEAVQSLDQVGVVLHVEQLQTQVWARVRRGG